MGENVIHLYRVSIYIYVYVCIHVYYTYTHIFYVIYIKPSGKSRIESKRNPSLFITIDAVVAFPSRIFTDHRNRQYRYPTSPLPQQRGLVQDYLSFKFFCVSYVASNHEREIGKNTGKYRGSGRHFLPLM